MTLQLNDAARERLTPPAIRGFLRIAELWALSEAQQVSILGGSLDARTIANWRQSPPALLGLDHLERMSYVLGIYEALERIFRHAPEQSGRWLQVPRPEMPFASRTPLDVMTSDGVVGLAAVRHYIDSVNGGPPSRDVARLPDGTAESPAREPATSTSGEEPRAEI